MKRFTIRVYGILCTEENHLLLVHEKMPTMHFTKFPGGGLEFGEGPRDCLKREYLEETGLEVEVGKHLYTTDFFQPSLFNPEDQLMAIYYQVNPLQAVNSISLEEQVIYAGGKEEILRFYWHPLNDALVNELTFPVDRHLANLMLSGEIMLR